MTHAPTRWLVISPHLDDAVFSCGRLLAAAPGSIVVTVFAGIPPRDTPAPPWDRRAGFDRADEAMHARRDEDRRALARLDARPVWLDFLDRDLLTSGRLDAVGVFGYSDEEGTEAMGLPGKLDQAEIDARVRRITDLVEELTAQRAEDRIGEHVEVLVEEIDDEDGSVVGRAAFQGPDVDGVTLVRLASGAPAPEVGDLVRAVVVGTDLSLVANQMRLLPLLALAATGLALAAAGLVAQRWCRVDGPDDEDPDRGPSARREDRTH